jgi:colicin import membrane protein
MIPSPMSVTRAWFYALLIHVLGGALFIFSMQWSSEADVFARRDCSYASIEAVAVSEADVNAELARIQAAQAARQENAEANLHALQEERTALEEIKQAQALELAQQQAAAQAEQEQARELMEQARLAREQEALKAEKLRLEMEKDALRLKQEADKLAQERAKEEARLQALAEARRKEKEELDNLKKYKEELNKEVAQLAKKQLAEEERQRQARDKAKAEEQAESKRQAARQAEAKARQEAAAASARQQAEADAAAASAAAAAAANRRAGEEARAISAITAKIQGRWQRPMGSSQGLSCLIQIRMVPSGDVISAQVIEGSGNIAFDRSAEAAVQAASPLPVPSDPALFEQGFRTLNLRFRPE